MSIGTSYPGAALDTVRQSLVAVAACIDDRPFGAGAPPTYTAVCLRYHRVAYWLAVPEFDFGPRPQANLPARHQHRSHFRRLVPGR